MIWSKNLPKTYSAPVPLWGYAGHPLVYKNLLICTVGGEGSAVVAFDKETGKEAWKAINTTEIGYSPPTLIEAGGVTQLLIFHGRSINSLNPDLGKLYWSEPLATAFSMAITNPATMIAAAGVFAAFGPVDMATAPTTAFWLVTGVFAGSALWWLILAAAVSTLRDRFVRGGLPWLNRISGSIIALSGTLVLIATILKIVNAK